MSARIRAEQVLNVLPAGEITGAEIGVWRGHMSAVLLKHGAMTLYMVDNWKPVLGLEERGYSEKDQYANRFMAWKQTDFAHDRRIILDMYSLNAAQFVPDAILDFAFLDADHSYDGVTGDIEAWFTKVKSGGFLCGHDYENEGEPRGKEVTRAVDEAFKRIGGQLMLGEDHTWFMRKP